MGKADQLALRAFDEPRLLQQITRRVTAKCEFWKYHQIGAARASSPLFVQAHVGAPALRWLLTLGLYDLVFGLIAYAVFDFLLED
jgi:hypothetical protein